MSGATFPPLRQALALLGTLLAAGPAAGRVVLDAPGHVCVAGSGVAARGGAPGAAWTLLDWRGRAAGAAGVFDERGEAALPLLPSGYYRMVAGADGGWAADCLATLAVVAPLETHPAEDSGFLALDTAQSWCAAEGKFECPWNGGDAFRTVCDLAALSGVRHVRDRFSWAKANPASGAFEYGENLRNAEMLRDRGIGVSEPVFHTPRRMATGDVRFADLAQIHDACARMAADMGKAVECWECWNELDLKGAPVWDDAAAQKAAYLGFKAGNPDATVLPASISGRPGQAYMSALFDNDIAKFGDAFNFHTYLAPADYPGLFGALRSFLAGRGIGGRAIWMTETGTNLEGPAARAGAMPGMMAHSPDQELVVAEFLPKSQILMRMQGVARAYHFLLCPYNERGGAKDWGAMRRDGSVKPVFAAIATLARELGAARLAGEMKAGEGVRAFLFDQPDGSQTVAFWAVSPVDTAATRQIAAATPDCAREWRLGLPGANRGDGAIYRLSDLCGMVAAVAATNGTLALPATRFPAYVSGLRGLAAEVAPVPPGRLTPWREAPDEDLSVVIRAELDERDFAVSNHKSLAHVKGESGRLRVQVWNLGDTSKTGTVEVAGAELAGLPETIALGPRGTPPAQFDCVISPPGGDPANATLCLSGVFGGRRSSQLSIPLLFERTLFAGCEAKPLEWRDPARWTRNDSASRRNFAWDEGERAMRWNAEWDDPGADRWIYPVYSLAPGETLVGAVAIRFEAKSRQDKVENDFSDSVCMLLGRDGRESWIRYPAPVGNWESRIVPLDEGEIPAGTAAFRIGANPAGSSLSLWIRNMEIIRRAE